MTKTMPSRFSMKIKLMMSRMIQALPAVVPATRPISAKETAYCQT